MKKCLIFFLFILLASSVQAKAVTKTAAKAAAKTVKNKVIPIAKTKTMIVSPEITAAKDRTIEFGYGAGAARFEFGGKYLNAGFGMGKNYIFLDMRMGTKIMIRDLFQIKPSIDLIYSSEKIRNIPGLSDPLQKGGSAGCGISLAKDSGKWEWSLGYSTVLGLNLMAGYKY